jgi:hypothetical protein
LYNKEVFGGNANDEMKYVQFGNPATLWHVHTSERTRRNHLRILYQGTLQQNENVDTQNTHCPNGMVGGRKDADGEKKAGKCNRCPVHPRMRTLLQCSVLYSYISTVLS